MILLKTTTVMAVSHSASQKENFEIVNMQSVHKTLTQTLKNVRIWALSICQSTLKTICQSSNALNKGIVNLVNLCPSCACVHVRT